MDNQVSHLSVSSSPHIRSGATTTKIMGTVIIALMPALVASVIIFGPRALLVTAVTVAAAVLFEFAWCHLRHQPDSIQDLSAVVTGLLLAFNVPSTIPLWMPVVGAFVSIVIVKELFGGIGRNFANPAIVGRMVLAVSFTSRMTAFPFPNTLSGVDALPSATPLAAAGNGAQLPYLDLLLGTHGGVLGETCSLALIIGGVFLIAVGTIKATIPVTYLATVAVISLLTGHDPLVQLLSGGLLLGLLHGHRLHHQPLHHQRPDRLRPAAGCHHLRHPVLGQHGRGRQLRHPHHEPAGALYQRIDAAQAAGCGRWQEMKAKNILWQETVKPVVVLLLICLISGLVLAAVNSVTAPIIAANEEAQAQATYSALLPEADHFSELSTTVDGVTNVLKADNGAGYIVVAAARGYKGDVVATVAFDNDGSILDLSMTAADETVGIGTKVTEEDFTGQFSGMPAENFAYGDVDAVSNATYSSKAAVEAINLAIQAYQEVRGN